MKFIFEEFAELPLLKSKVTLEDFVVFKINQGYFPTEVEYSHMGF